jgi:hypothetical protein
LPKGILDDPERQYFLDDMQLGLQRHPTLRGGAFPVGEAVKDI